jgi:CelD/BcsL family acetyltransferase involved in cellulose biosynthesis
MYSCFNPPATDAAIAPPAFPETRHAPTLIRSHDELDAQAPHWQLIARQMPLPTTHFTWCSLAARTFAVAQRLAVMMHRRGNQPAAIAPLIHRRLRGVRHAVLLGVDDLFEPMDLVYSDRDALDGLVESLLAWGTPLFLERVPADSPTVQAFTRIRRRGAVFCRPHYGYPYIPLDPTWAEPESHLNSGRRSDLRRALRHAQRHGPLTHQILTPTPDNLDALLDIAFAVEAASWKGKTGTALLHEPRRSGFYRRYAHAACHDGTLRLAFLKIGEHPVAMQIALQCSNAFWLLKIGYDAAFADCSPGNLLMCQTLRYAAAQNLRSYEFLGSAAPWTRAWTELERQCVSLWVYPLNPRGMTALVVHSAASLRHKLKHWRQS